ncbi:hypothetical protein PHPALM_28748 [Phytophthora palmivora]|uniref:Dynactin subunit 6 n=1 Tax=Phytophthora palmivora TaxID=4796 RepID=A0A2P4X9A1_9STRA|nr:hypothetical protein PHPALM_28748 [Phytophthora palmivora]
MSVGERCAVHPGASVLATGGSIVLGERCFVEDGVVLANDTVDEMKIGSDNLFESGCEVRSCSVGNGNWFEPKAKALEGSVVGSNCLIGSGVVVAEGERIPDNSILVAVQTPQGETRRVVRQQKDYNIKSHAALMQKYADLFSRGSKSPYALEKHHELRLEDFEMVKWRFCIVAAGLALVTSGEAVDGSDEVKTSDVEIESMQVNKTREELRFPVLFDAIVNRSVVLEHFAETHELRVRSIDEEKVAEVEVEITTDASTEQSSNPMAKLCVDGNDISMLSFQDVIDSPVGSVAVLPLFKPIDSVHVLSGFARVEILSPKMLEFEPATPTREEVVVAWVEEKARLKAEREACEREIANNKELQARLEQERRVAEALAQKERELLEKLDKEEYERTRMTPHNLAAGKRRDGWEFRYEVEFTTKGPIGLNWDLNTRNIAVVSHLEPKLPAQQLNVIAPRDQLIALNGVDTSKMGPQEVVEVYLSSALPRTPQASSNEAAGVVYLAYRGACTLIEKANHARTANGKALLVVNNVKGEGRFTPSVAALGEHVELPVTLMGKLDGELIMSVMEYQQALIRIYEERPDQIPVPLEQPKKLTNQELTIARDVKKSGRKLTFWYINASTTTANSKQDTGSGNSSSFTDSYEFEVLPALFGGKIPTMPFRVVAAYPQETACHYKGLGILTTRSVIVVKRGGCSFGAKLSDASLIPLMTDPRELEGLMIWGASINLMNGTAILDVLAKSKNLPTLVKIAAHEDEAANATISN